MALFQVDKIGGVTTFEFVREVTATEGERLTAAEQLVRRVARTTPYHSLEVARARFWESLAQASTEATEDPEVRRARCAGALERLLTVVAGHGTEWLAWLADVLGGKAEVPAAVGEAIDAFTGTQAAQTAARLAWVSDRELELLQGDHLDAVARSETEGLQVQVRGWLADLEEQAILAMDAGLQAVKAPLDDASRFVLNLAAEVMTGTPIVAPTPTTQGWDSVNLGAVDVAAVRAAQSLSWQSRTFAAQIRAKNRGGTQPPSPSQAGPEEPGEPGDAGGDGDGLEQEQQDSSEPADLPAVMVNLHGVIDAMARNVDGLVRQWSKRFATDEFAQALETEQAQISSLLHPLQRALQVESAAAGEAGYSNTLPGYPVPLHEMPAWSSAVPAEQLWTYQSVATVHAVQLYIAALEDIGKPARFKFEQGKELEVEFEPLAAAALHASGRLLAELIEENAVTLADLTGKNLGELGLAPTPDYLVRQLVRALKTSQAFGLPEASLIYTLRLLSALDFEADESEAEIIEAAQAEVIRYISGQAASRGVALILADALVQVADSARERQRMSAQPLPSDAGTTLNDDATASPQTEEGDGD
ncbi:MAG: hypothetical protein ACYDDU_19360 [Dermatophilaceae bacterium]